MSDLTSTSRREFVKVTGAAAVGALPDESSAPARRTLRDYRRHRRSRQWHVGRDLARALSRPAGVRRLCDISPKRAAVAGTFTARRTVRPSRVSTMIEDEARPAGGHHRRRFPSRIHHRADRARRDDRETADHHDGVPGILTPRSATRKIVNHLQLPYAPTHQQKGDLLGEIGRVVGGLQRYSTSSTARLLPPVASRLQKTAARCWSTRRAIADP